MKRMFPVLMALTSLLSYSVSLQTPDLKSKSSHIATNWLSQSRQLDRIKGLMQWVSGIRDTNASALTTAEIADLVWLKDEKYSRELFLFSLYKSSADPNDSTKESAAKATTYRKIISLIARHDLVWSKKLLDSYSQQSEKRAGAGVEIANGLIESDPERASDFLRQSAGLQISEGLVTVLKNLRTRNRAEADRLFSEIIACCASQPSVSAYQFAYLGTYLFTSPFTDPTDTQVVVISRVSNFGMPNLGVVIPDTPAELIREYLTSALSIVGRLTGDFDQQQQQYALVYILLPKVVQFVPNLAGAYYSVMNSLGAIVPPDLTSDDAYRNITKTKRSSPEERIEEIEKISDSITRDQLLLDLVFQAWSKNDFSTAKLAASKIDGRNIRDELNIIELFAETRETLKVGQVNAVAIKGTISNLPYCLERALLSLGLARVANKNKDRQLEEEMLGSALDCARRQTDESVPFLLSYISGQMKQRFDPQSLIVLIEAVNAFNRFENSQLPPFTHNVSAGDLTIRFPISIKEVDLNFGSTLTNALSGNDDQDVSVVKDLKDERLRGLAYVAVAKTILTNKTPNPDVKQDKVIRVGEDGIRKSAARTFMPVYPTDALRKKIKGVVVAEVQYDGDGDVKDIQVLEAPDEALSRSVIEAIKQWKFKPSKLDGRPISVRGKITFYFDIDSKGKGNVRNPSKF